VLHFIRPLQSSCKQPLLGLLHRNRGAQLMSLEKRIEKLEKALGLEELSVLLIKWAADVPMTKASYGDFVVVKRNDETQDEFEVRAVNEAKSQPKLGNVRVIFLWLSEADKMELQLGVSGASDD
jgi:hypothetical protein